jgi:hypothetical protein
MFFFDNIFSHSHTVTQSHRTNRNKTIMNDELGEVKADIARTKSELATAKAEGKEELVLSLNNLLVKLYDKEARLGEIYCNRGVMRYSVVSDITICDIEMGFIIYYLYFSDTADFSMIFTVGNLPR